MANSNISIQATAVWKARRIDESRAISLTIAPGEIVLLTGRTGSGKTTLLNLLSGYDNPDGGQVRLQLRERVVVFGADGTLPRVPPQQLARYGLGRSFQAPPQFSDFTTAEIWSIAVQRERRLDDVTESELVRFLEESGVTIDNPRAMLPFGHRKLFGVCLAFLVGTEIVFLDEPLAGLSQHLSERVMSLIMKMRERGRTMLIAEHRETSHHFRARGIELWPENV